MKKKITRRIWLFILCFPIIAFSQTQEKCNKKIKEGIELLSKNEYRKSLEVLTVCLEEANFNDWKYEAYMATNNIGSNYYGLGDLNEAIIYYLEAFQIAEEHLDKNSQMASINNIAVIYFQDRDFEKAHQYFKKAYSLASDIQSKQKQGLYALNIALVSNKMKDLDEAWIYIEKAEELLQYNKELSVRVNLAKAEWHLLQGNLKSAETKLLQVTSVIEENELKEDKMLQQILLSEIYLQQEKLDLALQHAVASRKVTSGKENLINSFEMISKVYTEQKDYVTALIYKDSITTYKDSVFSAKIDNTYQQNKVKFQVLDYQQELRESKLEASKNKILIYSLLSIGGLLVFLAIFLLRNYKEKEKNRKKLAALKLAKKRSENMLLEKQLKQKDALSQLSKERYKNEMDVKNRELLSKAFVQSSQIEAIQDLVKLSENKTKDAKTEDLQSGIDQLKQFLVNKNRWQNFFLHFEKTNPGFIKRLSNEHPNLNASELRFVTYVYINLSNKEIASLLNITDSSVRKRKERFAKKINLSSSSELYSYLLSI